MHDAGALVRDAGALMRDSGALVRDAGALMHDAGALMRDAGAPVHVAGAVMHGAGARLLLHTERVKFNSSGQRPRNTPPKTHLHAEGVKPNPTLTGSHNISLPHSVGVAHGY